MASERLSVACKEKLGRLYSKEQLIEMLLCLSCMQGMSLKAVYRWLCKEEKLRAAQEQA